MIYIEPFEAGSEVTISAITPTTADVAWERTPCPASEFIVEYTLMKEDQCMPQNMQQVVTFGRSEGEPMVLKDLKPFSQYMVMVRAETASGSIQALQTLFDTEEDGLYTNQTFIISSLL